MKNLFLSAALVLALSVSAAKVNQATTITKTKTVKYQEKEYKKIEQSEITPEVMKSAVAKYQGYSLVDAYVAQDGSDYKFVLTKDGKDIAAYFKSSGEFIKEETT